MSGPEHGMLGGSGVSEAMIQASLASDQGHKFYKGDFGVHLHLKFLIEAFGLSVVNENEEAVAVESFEGFFILFLPINLTLCLKLVSVEDFFGIGGFD